MPLLGYLVLRIPKKFIFHRSSNIEPFIWLQSEDDLNFSLLIIDPRMCRPDYTLELKKNDLQDLNIEDGDENAVFVIASITGEIKDTTLNFKGPLVFNLTKRLFQQVIVESEELKVPMFNQPK